MHSVAISRSTVENIIVPIMSLTLFRYLFYAVEKNGRNLSLLHWLRFDSNYSLDCPRMKINCLNEFPMEFDRLSSLQQFEIDGIERGGNVFHERDYVMLETRYCREHETTAERAINAANFLSHQGERESPRRAFHVVWHSESTQIVSASFICERKINVSPPLGTYIVKYGVYQLSRHRSLAYLPTIRW